MKTLPPCDHDECPPTRCLKVEPRRVFKDERHLRCYKAVVAHVANEVWTKQRRNMLLVP